MENTENTIRVIEFHFFLTARVRDPAHVLKIQITRRADDHEGVVLEHTDSKGVKVENVSSPQICNINPTELLIDLVNKYFERYDTTCTKPVFTIVR